ncbi:LamB/YcsF family protein [Pedobacter faecalis]|uniref:LamB/YcsF family protein n=1 Tax=Pedobacter faecalis TaxID=3041495 RepID=UPI00254C8D5F|nr:5-oxoprolinase subunit PxpA [Pedobacter sp. ELA7]
MKSDMSVDLNCDMGEGFGVYSAGKDVELMPYVTSVNIACGFHAGDASVMKRTVRLALEHGLAVGAHPGLQDLKGFGRREMSISHEEAYDITVYQVGALAAFVKSEGGILHHVKPHGALYNMAAENRRLSEAIAEAVARVAPELILYGLSGSELLVAGRKLGLPVASEVFADRRYQSDRTLVPRTQPSAVIADEDEALQQVLSMVKTGVVQTPGGNSIEIQADTICIHGDSPRALEFTKKIYHGLQGAGVTLSAYKQGPDSYDGK